MLDNIKAFAEKHHMFPPEGMIIATVSGGADSVSLLAALSELRGKYGFTVVAAHFNHRLRGEESDRDEQFVRNLCASEQLTLYIGSADVGHYARENHLSVEDAARRLRYDFFEETAKKAGAVRIATAHTADDNTETVIFNLTRGAGLNGLGGIPPVRGKIIRPMLTVTRGDVLSFLSERSLSFVTDSSNASEQYSRNLIRRRVIPVLKDLNPRLAQNVTATAARLREDELYLAGLAADFISHHTHHCANGATSLNAGAIAALPGPVAVRAVRLLAGVSLSSEHINAVLELIRSGRASGRIDLPSVTVTREYEQILFTPAKQPGSPVSPPGFQSIGLSDGERKLLPELGLAVSCKKRTCDEKINKSFTTFLFKFDNICGNIVIRPRETGDNIELFGRNVTKSLKKLFIEERIPLQKRPLVPVVADAQGVLGVYGLGFDKRMACRPGETALEIIFEKSVCDNHTTQ